MNWRLKFEESRGDFSKKNSRPRPAYPNRRSLPQGQQIIEILRSRYEMNIDERARSNSTSTRKRHVVRVFYGNESLDDTIRLFRSAKYFIGAHGGGMTNILFMVGIFGYIVYLT